MDFLHGKKNNISPTASHKKSFANNVIYRKETHTADKSNLISTNKEKRKKGRERRPCYHFNIFIHRNCLLLSSI